MKRLLMITALMMAAPAMYAQNQPAYEILRSEKPGEVIYRGPCTFADLEQVPAFDLLNRSQAYKPDTRKTAALAEQLKEYRLLVFLGTWCEDSHRLIPELYRVLKDAGYPPDAVQLYALDRSKKGKDGEEQEYNITNVPTIIVLEEGTEKGRITETVQKTVESDLLHILEKE